MASYRLVLLCALLVLAVTQVRAARVYLLDDGVEDQDAVETSVSLQTAATTDTGDSLPSVLTHIDSHQERKTYVRKNLELNESATVDELDSGPLTTLNYDTVYQNSSPYGSPNHANTSRDEELVHSIAAALRNHSEDPNIWSPDQHSIKDNENPNKKRENQHKNHRETDEDTAGRNSGNHAPAEHKTLYRNGVEVMSDVSGGRSKGKLITQNRGAKVQIDDSNHRPIEDDDFVASGAENTYNFAHYANHRPKQDNVEISHSGAQRYTSSHDEDVRNFKHSYHREPELYDKPRHGPSSPGTPNSPYRPPGTKHRPPSPFHGSSATDYYGSPAPSHISPSYSPHKPVGSLYASRPVDSYGGSANVYYSSPSNAPRRPPSDPPPHKPPNIPYGSTPHKPSNSPFGSSLHKPPGPPHGPPSRKPPSIVHGPPSRKPPGGSPLHRPTNTLYGSQPQKPHGAVFGSSPHKPFDSPAYKPHNTLYNPSYTDIYESPDTLRVSQAGPSHGSSAQKSPHPSFVSHSSDLYGSPTSHYSASPNSRPDGLPPSRPIHSPPLQKPSSSSYNAHVSEPYKSSLSSYSDSSPQKSPHDSGYVDSYGSPTSPYSSRPDNLPHKAPRPSHGSPSNKLPRPSHDHPSELYESSTSSHGSRPPSTSHGSPSRGSPSTDSHGSHTSVYSSPSSNSPYGSPSNIIFDEASTSFRGSLGSSEGGPNGPMYTFVKTDPHGNVKWGVRHSVGSQYAGSHH